MARLFNHYYNAQLAEELGLDTAAFLTSLAHWTYQNLINSRNIHDGLCWSYNSLEAYKKHFRYWSKRQLERIIKHAEDAGFLVKGNFNEAKYDRTAWYALTLKAYPYFVELMDNAVLEPLSLLISPNGEMHFTKRGNAFHETVTPIPSNILSSSNINITTSNNDSDFEETEEKPEEQKPEKKPRSKKQISEEDHEKEKEKRRERFKRQALSDHECVEVFEKRFKGVGVTLERLFQDCEEYWESKGELVYKARFLSHLRKCPVANYKATKEEQKQQNQEETLQRMLEQERVSRERSNKILNISETRSMKEILKK